MKGLDSSAAPSPPGRVAWWIPWAPGRSPPRRSTVLRLHAPRLGLRRRPLAPSSHHSTITQSHLFREAVPEFLSQTQSRPFHNLISSETAPETRTSPWRDTSTREDRGVAPGAEQHQQTALAGPRAAGYSVSDLNTGRLRLGEAEPPPPSVRSRSQVCETLRPEQLPARHAAPRRQEAAAALAGGPRLEPGRRRAKPRGPRHARRMFPHGSAAARSSSTRQCWPGFW